MISGSPSAKARTRRRRARPSWPRRRQAPGDSCAITVRRRGSSAADGVGGVASAEPSPRHLSRGTVRPKAGRRRVSRRQRSSTPRRTFGDGQSPPTTEAEPASALVTNGFFSSSWRRRRRRAPGKAAPAGWSITGRGPCERGDALLEGQIAGRPARHLGQQVARSNNQVLVDFRDERREVGESAVRFWRCPTKRETQRLGQEEHRVLAHRVGQADERRRAVDSHAWGTSTSFLTYVSKLSQAIPQEGVVLVIRHELGFALRQLR